MSLRWAGGALVQYPLLARNQGALALVVRLEPGGVGCRLVREGMAEGYARVADAWARERVLTQKVDLEEKYRY